LTSCNNSICHFPNTNLVFEELFIILRTLIISKTLFIQYNVLHHMTLSRSKIMLTNSGSRLLWKHLVLH
ncbi:hypothetical protein T11_18256, partial [Trichinella zimbabwensis]